VGGGGASIKKFKKKGTFPIIHRSKVFLLLVSFVVLTTLTFGVLDRGLGRGGL